MEDSCIIRQYIWEACIPVVWIRPATWPHASRAWDRSPQLPVTQLQLIPIIDKNASCMRSGWLCTASSLTYLFIREMWFIDWLLKDHIYAATYMWDQSSLCTVTDDMIVLRVQWNYFNRTVLQPNSQTDKHRFFGVLSYTSTYAQGGLLTL